MKAQEIHTSAPWSPSAQEVFDVVVTHLYRQGRRAMHQSGTCQYRTRDGLSCAVGCLIEDEEYQPSFEGKDALSIFLPRRLEPHKNLLAELQRAHDYRGCGDAGTLEDVLRRTAQQFDLQYRAEHYPAPPAEWK